jgi:restriction system protein
MAAKGATGGFVVTSGRFTDEAISFASGRNVALIDGPNLHGLLRQAQAGAERSPAQMPAVPGAHSPASSAQALACPLCAKPMVRRTAKRGANVGNEFWGCTGYPNCRGTRPIN